MRIKISDFGKTYQGVQTHLYTMENQNGVVVSVSDYGATLVSVEVPDKNGVRKDVVLGYDCVEDYEKGTNYFGACIGRNGNRIKDAQAVIGTAVYQMEKNEGENGLHSGSEGYSNIVWETQEVGPGNTICFRHLGKDGEQGLPGNFDITVTYTLTENNGIEIHYRGISDKDTIANLTNHAYFNLAGHDFGSVEGHTLWLNAEAFTPVGEGMLPTGEIADVCGTPMDFTEEKPIGRDIGCSYEQLEIAGGYDHNYVLPPNPDGDIRKIATAKEETTGRRLDVYTNNVGVQFYAGNFITGEPLGKGETHYGKRSGFCLETQCFPDAGHHENFPSCVLRAGELYDTTTIYVFSVL